MKVDSSTPSSQRAHHLGKVIFDSSFLMAIVETPTTWFEDIVDAIGGFQPVLLDCVREELEGLAVVPGRKSRLARVSLDLAADFKPSRCGKSRVDDEILSVALRSGAMVATTDETLARSARALHLKVISLRRGRVSLH
jgi:rRNA-processing protein FCF1